MHEITIKVESYDEFAARHGGNPIRIKNGKEILFRDGAAVLVENRDMRAEPAEDEQLRFSYRQAYYREAIKLCREEFEKMQSYAVRLVENQKRFPLRFQVPEDLVINLEKKKAEYQKLVSEFNTILAEFKATPQQREERERQKELDRIKQQKYKQAERIDQAINNISL